MYRFYWSWPALILLLVACQTQQSIKPIRPTATPAGGVISGQPVLVTFTELESEPFRYRNQVIRVSGDYVRLPSPACRYERGPRLRWALVAEGFRLDAIGFEPILRLVPEGLPLTVDGIWRRYEGRLGCGKGAPSGIAWYLQVERIVHPNPLPQFEAVTSPPAPVVPGPPQPPVTPEPVLPAETVTPSGSPPISPATASPSPTPTTSPSLGTATVTPLISPTRTVTPTPVATPISSPTATAAAGTPPPLPGTPPPLPATPTATPATPGYPGPPQPPTVTPPSPYP
jgi:hypothetical protein